MEVKVVKKSGENLYPMKFQFIGNKVNVGFS